MKFTVMVTNSELKSLGFNGEHGIRRLQDYWETELSDYKEEDNVDVEVNVELVD